MTLHSHVSHICCLVRLISQDQSFVFFLWQSSKTLIGCILYNQRVSATESEPTDGKRCTSRSISTYQRTTDRSLRHRGRLEQVDPRTASKIQTAPCPWNKAFVRVADSTGSVKEPLPKQQKMGVDDDFQAFLSFLPEIDLEWGDLDQMYNRSCATHSRREKIL